MEDNMTKKISALFFIIGCILIVITGCRKKNQVVNYKSTDQEITTITFFGNKYEPENVIVIETIISDFMKENLDIRVSYESLKGNEYYDALEKRMVSGKGNDVFMVNHDSLLDLTEKGQLADLSNLSVISDYTDQMQNQMKEEDGTIYWLPTTVSVFGLYCNMDLLREHRQEVPETLIEWQQVCNYFIDQNIIPVIANNDISLKTLAIGRGFFELYQENHQTEVFRGLNKGEEKLSNYLESGFEIVKLFIDKNYIDAKQALNTQKTSDDLNEFVKGESSFMLTGAWAAGRVKGMKPDFTFKVLPLPILDDGSLLVINADTRLSVNADSNDLEAAMKFVEYFTQHENIQKFADQQSSFSPLKGGNPSCVKEVQPLISAYKSGRIVIGTDSLLKFPIWDLTEEVSKQLLSGETLEHSMEWLNQQF